ncbi:MAG: glutathione S-transferase family protein [Pseudomonadota bacterium]
MTLKLYSMPSSGNSHKVRMLLAFLGVDYEHVALEYETPELAEAHAAGLLPLKRLPVLELEDGTQLPESNAILCYLAEGTAWMPEDPLARAQVLSWMFWEQNQHEGTIAVRAALRMYSHRAHLATPERMAELLDAGNERLAMMEDALQTHDWLVGETPTIADIALYSYTHTAEERGGFDLTPFPAIRAWLARMVAMPDYVGLFETPDA